MNAQLRIAFTHEHCWPYVRRGGERILHELAGALARRGHDVTIAAGSPTKGTTREDEVRVVRLLRRNESLPQRAGFGLSLLTHLLTSDYDIVHSLGPRDALMAIRSKRLRPNRIAVFTNLGLPMRSWWDAQPTATAHDRVVADIDVYGCLSRYGVDCLRREYGREGALTSGGVSVRTFRPLAPREPYPTIFYSGVLDDPRKGVGTLLQALSLLAVSEPRVALWLAGPGDPEAILASAPADALRRTTVLPRTSVHLGTSPDQVRRYSAAWVTALPSVAEALGIVLLESLACGTPIVASDDAGSREIVRPQTGALSRPQDPDALAEACAAAIDLARSNDARDNCREAARAYDWDSAIAPDIEATYAKALGLDP